MNSPLLRLWVATLAAMTPAILGAVLFARLQPVGRGLTAAFFMGILCGVAVLAISRSQGWSSVGAGIVAALIGVAFGFIFDAKWNSVAQVAAQMKQDYGLGEAEAMQQARTILGGMSLFELIRSRLDWGGGLSFLFAAVGAGLTVKSRFFGRLLRVREE